MAEAFSLRTKNASAESYARQVQGQRTWMVVGITAFAVLLMGTSVVALQRRFNLIRRFYPSHTAAAAAAMSHEDTGTLRRIKELERGLRELRSLMPSLSISGKSQADGDVRTLRAKKTKVTKRGVIARHRQGKHASGDRDVASSGIDVSRTLDISQRSFTDMTQPADRNYSVGIADPSSERGLDGKGVISTETKSALRAGFGPREEIADRDKISFTPITGESNATSPTMTTRPALRETTTPKLVPEDNTTVWSSSGHTRSHQRNRMVKKRRKFHLHVNRPSLTTTVGSMTSQAAMLDSTSNPQVNDAKRTKEQSEVSVQKKAAARDNFAKFTKKFLATGTTGAVANSEGMSPVSDTSFYNATKTSSYSAKSEPRVASTRASNQAAIRALEKGKASENKTTTFGNQTSSEKNNGTIYTNMYMMESRNATLEEWESHAETLFSNDHPTTSPTASTRRDMAAKGPFVTLINAHSEVSTPKYTSKKFGSFISASSGMTGSYLDVIEKENGEKTVPSATGKIVAEAVISSEKAASYASTSLTSVYRNFTATLSSELDVTSSRVIRPLRNLVAFKSSLKTIEPTTDLNNRIGSALKEDNKAVDDVISKAAENTGTDESGLKLEGLSLSRDGANVTISRPKGHEHKHAKWSNERTNAVETTWEKSSTNTLTFANTTNLARGVSPLNRTAITVRSQGKAETKSITHPELNSSETKNVTYSGSTPATNSSVAEFSVTENSTTDSKIKNLTSELSTAEYFMIENSTKTASKITNVTSELSTGNQWLKRDLTVPSSVRTSWSAQYSKKVSSTVGMSMLGFTTTAVISTSEEVLSFLRQTEGVISPAKVVSTNIPGLKEKFVTEIAAKPGPLISEVIKKSNTTTAAVFSDMPKNERVAEVGERLADHTNRVSRNKTVPNRTAPPSQGSLRHSVATSSLQIPKLQVRITDDAQSSPGKHEFDLRKNETRWYDLGNGSAVSKGGAKGAFNNLYSSLKAALEEERKQRQNMNSQEMLDYWYGAPDVNSTHFTINEDDIFPMPNIGEARHARIDGKNVGTAFAVLTSLNKRGSASLPPRITFRNSFGGNLTTRKLRKGESPNVGPQNETNTSTSKAANEHTTGNESNNSSKSSKIWRITDKPVHSRRASSFPDARKETVVPVTASSRKAQFDADSNKSAVVMGREMTELRRSGVICSYNASHYGWQSGQASYSLASIPYEYCSSVLYCCLSLTNELDIEEFGNHTDLQHLATAKKKYHGLKTLVAIGGSSSNTVPLRHLISNQVHRDIFVQLTAHWMQRRHFDGAYLYWPEMQDSDYNDLTSAFRALASSFNKLRLKLGIILSVRNRAFVNEAALEALTKDLEGFYGQILLSPPDLYDTVNSTVISYHTEWLTQAYDTYPATLPGLASVSFCPMIPFWGTTFTIKAALEESIFVLKPIGHGAPRVTSGEPGKVAYFEICRELNSSEYHLPEQFIIGNEYVKILTPASLERHLSSMVARKPWPCLGVWGVEWDDFGGRCGSVRYPLLKTLSEFQVKHLI